MRNFKTATVLLFFIFTIYFLWGEDKIPMSFEAGIITEYLTGQTLYQIGDYIKNKDGKVFDVPFNMSQLKFTINDPLIHAGFKLSEFKPGWSIEAGIKKNIPLIKDTLYDSDWGAWYLDGYPWANYYTLDIYSTSGCTKDIWLGYIYTAVKFWSFKNLSLSFNSGLEYDYYFFEASDGNQYYPSYNQYKDYLPSSYSGTDIFDSVGIRYTINEIVLPILTYFKADMWLFHLKIGGGGLCGLYYDNDDHVLRSKKSIGTGMLIGARGEIGLEYEISKNLTLKADGRFDYLTGSGEQTQTRYQDTQEGPAGFIGTLGQKIETYFWNVGIGISYKL